jgi:hypothetical protein
MVKNWVKLYSNYQGQWVALKGDETTVIASGKKLNKVLKEAHAQGYEKPIVAKIPKNNLVYIGNILSQYQF